MSQSTRLQDAVIDRIKEKAKPYFRDVLEYGGEFTSEEVNFDSFIAPAAFVAALGWSPENSPVTVTGKNPKRIRIVVFVATKNTKRNVRAREAMQRAEFLTGIFNNWKPFKGLGASKNLSAENLYSRGIDKRGMALWMLSWWHEIGFDDTTLPSIDDYPDLIGVDVRTEGHIPPVSGNAAPEPDLTYETRINLEKEDEQQD